MVLIGHDNEPLLVKNPATGREINVAPLFAAVAQLSEVKGSTSDLGQVIDNAIRAIALGEIDVSCTTYKNPKSLLYDLYLLKDTFDCMG